MATQLQSFVDANGTELRIGHRVFTFLGAGTDGDIAVGTVKSVRATYNMVRSNRTRVFRHDGAEVWVILGPKGRNIAQFAVHEGKLIELS